MKNIAKRAYVIVTLITIFFILLSVLLFRFITLGDEWATKNFNSHIYTNGIMSVAGTIYDRNGEMLATSTDGKRIYNDDFYKRTSTLHVVGDPANYIATGVQNLYKASLIGYNFVDGVYNTISSKDGSDITLTIDANVSAQAYKAMDGNKGTVSVYNYETGEVICMVSAPTFDPMNKPTDQINDTSNKKYEAVYLNRSISGVFTPGSTFKIVTAICAIENIADIDTRTFTCEGKYETKSGDVICNGVHGKLDFERALNVSCNTVFAQLANELGPEKLTQTVRDLGFAKNINVSKAETVKSTFDVSDAAAVDLGWAGIGQYTTLINPTQMLMLMGTIANDAVSITPYTVEKSAELIDYKGTINNNISLSEETAKKIKAMLRSNVENYYGDSKFPELQMCGKTGTAEVMNGEPHAWFVGFSQRDDFPYAIVVCLENGGVGLNDAIPVASEVMGCLYDSLNE